MTFLQHVLVGAVTGALSAALLLVRKPAERGEPLAVFLGVAAGIYVGYGLQDGRPDQIAVQMLGALPFVIVAAGWPRAIALLGIAWLCHGLWDGAHELGLIRTALPSWYPGACLGVDLVLGAAALTWSFRRLPSSSQP
jgi:hypothetical protein